MGTRAPRRSWERVRGGRVQGRGSRGVRDLSGLPPRRRGKRGSCPQRGPSGGRNGGRPGGGGVTLGGRAKTTGSSASGANSSTSSRRALHTFLATVASAAICAIGRRSGPARDCPRLAPRAGLKPGGGSGEGTALAARPLPAPPRGKGWCLRPRDWGGRRGPGKSGNGRHKNKERTPALKAVWPPV